MTPEECVHDLMNGAYAAMHLGWTAPIEEKIVHAVNKFGHMLPSAYPDREDVVTTHTTVAALTAYISAHTGDPSDLINMLDRRVRKLSTLVQ